MSDVTIWLEPISEQWGEIFGPITTNLRRVRLALNDIDLAASILKGEVNREDLIGITIIQRFNPELYSAICKYGDFLTLDQLWLKQRRYIPESAQKTRDEEAKMAINLALNNCSRPEAFRSLLYSLFPSIRSKLGASKSFQAERVDREKAAAEKKISHPDYFPIYFRYEVPQAIVSARDFASVLEQIRKNPDTYSTILMGFPKGSLRRFDFLSKLSSADLDIVSAELLSYAVSIAADRYLYDMLDVGEAALALDIIFETAKKIPDCTGFLIRCLMKATDDTFAIRIMRTSTAPEFKRLRDFSSVEVDVEAIDKAFVARMRHRYNYRKSHATDITTSDPQAFWKWSDSSHEDKIRVHRFWRKFIAGDKRQLAFAAGMFFVRFAWNENPAPLVHKIFTKSYLIHALRYFPTAVFSDSELRGLEWLQDFVDGKYEHGVPINFR